MQTIPPVLYSAAKVDGAGPFRRFIHVTLPQLRNVLFVVILLRSIWMFTKFDTVWLLTQGGGADKYIRTLPVYAYMRTFMYYQAGLGSALAVIMFLILVAATTIPKNNFFSLRGQFIYWCAAILAVSTAFPFFWMVSTSFKPLQEIFVSPPNFLPVESTLANFERLFEQTRFLTYFRNSVFVSFTTVVLTTVFNFTAAKKLPA
jgi:ABC-type sugar transport system permease subunit